MELLDDDMADFLKDDGADGTDLNLQPAPYRGAALPFELRRHLA